MKAIKWLIFLSFLLSGCTSYDEVAEGILSVQINPALEAQPISLSELMDIDRIVALETSDSVLLPEHFEIALTERFIITVPHDFFSRNASLNQFDTEGNFIRVLAKSGPGPLEYTGINLYAVDAKNEIFYFMHRGDAEHIQRIDLNSGEFIERIYLPINAITRSEKLVLADLDILPDGTLACTPKMEPGVDQLNYQIFYLSPEGDFKGGVSAYMDSGFINPLAHTTIVRDELHYFGHNPDTLFVVKDTIRNPLMIVKTPKPFDVASQEGHVLYDLLEGPSSLVCMAIHLPLEALGGGNWKEPLSGIYLINKENGQSTKISTFNLDPLHIETEPKAFSMYGYPNGGKAMLQEIGFSNIFTSGDLGAVKIDALTFKEEGARIISEGTAPRDVLNQVQQLDDQVTEESNPILIIGKWK